MQSLCKNHAQERLEDEKEFPKIMLPELHHLASENLPLLFSFCLPLTAHENNHHFLLHYLMKR